MNLILLAATYATTTTSSATTTTTSNAATSTTHLTGVSGSTVLWLVVLLIAVSGLVAILGRKILLPKTGAPGGTSVIRSWLAIALVGGLLLLAAASFLIDDASLRSAVIGGVV